MAAAISSRIAEYGKQGRLEDARVFFHKSMGCCWGASSWNAMITAYAQNGHLQDARLLFETMPKRDSVSWNAMIAAYAQNGLLQDATLLFRAMPCQNPVSWNALISAHARYGHLEEAVALLHSAPSRGVVSWTAVIAACTKRGQGGKAFRLFEAMNREGVKPNWVTYVGVLEACSLACGKTVHASVVAHALTAEVMLSTALLKMYASCERLDDARRVFDRILQKDTISQTAMIAAYSVNGQVQNARNIFDLMPTRDPFAWNTMVAAYAQNGHLEDAKQILNTMPYRDVVSWTAVIAACVQNNRPEEALKLYDKMGIKPNKITLSSALDACSHLAALKPGKCIHSAIVESGSEPDTTLENSLINMYGRCGKPNEARCIFDNMRGRDLVSWNTMLAVHAHNGQGDCSLKLLDSMGGENIRPDKITFINLLSACSHAGLLDEGMRCFDSMYFSYNIVPLVDHQVCIIDLLGRSGRLEEAEDLIKCIPSEPPFDSHVVGWRCLLGACRIHGDAERGSHAAEHLMELDPENDDASYVSLSKVYAALGRWDDMRHVRKSMEERSIGE